MALNIYYIFMMEKFNFFLIGTLKIVKIMTNTNRKLIDREEKKDSKFLYLRDIT